MAELLFFSGSIVGLFFILKYSQILNYPRELIFKVKFLKDLIQCGQCSGFWIGLIFGILLKQHPIVFLLLAFYSSLICWLGDHIMMVIWKYLYPDEE